MVVEHRAGRAGPGTARLSADPPGRGAQPSSTARGPSRPPAGWRGRVVADLVEQDERADRLRVVLRHVGLRAAHAAVAGSCPPRRRLLAVEEDEAQLRRVRPGGRSARSVACELRRRRRRRTRRRWRRRSPGTSSRCRSARRARSPGACRAACRRRCCSPAARPGTASRRPDGSSDAQALGEPPRRLRARGTRPESRTCSRSRRPRPRAVEALGRRPRGAAVAADAADPPPRRRRRCPGSGNPCVPQTTSPMPIATWMASTMTSARTGTCDVPCPPGVGCPRGHPAKDGRGRLKAGGQTPTT